MEKIVAVVVTYNGMKWIDRCLGSLYASSVPVIPVVVDNRSTDGTVPFVRKNYPGCVVLEMACNLGFGQANNAGIRYALDREADYILLLNQDVCVEREMIGSLLRQAGDDVLLTPVHLNGSGDGLDRNFKLNTLCKCPGNGLIDDWALNCVSGRYEVSYANAACWLLPVALIRKIGGFNPLFFHYGEDDNYIQRLRYHGAKIYVVPEARMFHDRLVVGNMQMYKKGLVYRMLLLIATDINLGPMGRVRKRMTCFAGFWSDAVSSGTWRNLPAFFFAWLKTGMRWRTIRKSRRLERRGGDTWL